MECVSFFFFLLFLDLYFRSFFFILFCFRCFYLLHILSFRFVYLIVFHFMFAFKNCLVCLILSFWLVGWQSGLTFSIFFSCLFFVCFCHWKQKQTTEFSFFFSSLLVHMFACNFRVVMKLACNVVFFLSENKHAQIAKALEIKLSSIFLRILEFNIFLNLRKFKTFFS